MNENVFSPSNNNSRGLCRARKWKCHFYFSFLAAFGIILVLPPLDFCLLELVVPNLTYLLLAHYFHTSDLDKGHIFFTHLVSKFYLPKSFTPRVKHP